MDRRAFVRACAALVAASTAPAGAKTPTSDELEQHDIVLDADKRIARRALVLAPKRVPAGTKLPVLVLLHGLGETGNEELGVNAWGERYGLVRAHERLASPPVARTLPKANYFGDERLARVNRELAERPFRGLVLVCPVTPNPSKVGLPANEVFERYGSFLGDRLLPKVRELVPCSERTGLDGCSLGGWVAVEVFLRRPELFATLGGVQAALGTASAERHAARIAEIARTRKLAVHVETSSRDPFRHANERFAKKLRDLGVAVDLDVIPGPHDQAWLREVGTLEMLHWQDRHL